jgi:hypothetical protein
MQMPLQVSGYSTSWYGPHSSYNTCAAQSQHVSSQGPIQLVSHANFCNLRLKFHTNHLNLLSNLSTCHLIPSFYPISFQYFLFSGVIFINFPCLFSCTLTFRWRWRLSDHDADGKRLSTSVGVSTQKPYTHVDLPIIRSNVWQYIGMFSHHLCAERWNEWGM